MIESWADQEAMAATDDGGDLPVRCEDLPAKAGPSATEVPVEVESALMLPVRVHPADVFPVQRPDDASAADNDDFVSVAPSGVSAARRKFDFKR